MQRTASQITVMPADGYSRVGLGALHAGFRWKGSTTPLVIAESRHLIGVPMKSGPGSRIKGRTGTLTGPSPAMTTPCPIVLDADQITRADRLTIELVKPPDMPAAVLIKWPPARSVVEPNPKALASVAASVVQVPGEAQASLAKMGSRP